MNFDQDLQPINTSAVLRAAGYDVAAQLLTVEKKNGERWEYPDIDSHTWEDLMGGIETNHVFEGIENRSRQTKRRVDLADEERVETAGERVERRRLDSEFGHIGSPTRTRYEDLMRRRQNLLAPSVALTAQLEDVRARHAAAVAVVVAKPSRDALAEVGGLWLEGVALEQVLAAAAPATAEIDDEIETLRADYQRGAMDRLRSRVQHQQQRTKDFARLAELKALIRNPGAIDPMTLGKHYAHMSLETALKTRMDNWLAERAEIRARLGLPDDVKGDDGADARSAWLTERAATRAETADVAS